MTAALCTWVAVAAWVGRGRVDVYRRRRRTGSPMVEAVTGRKPTRPVPDVTAVG